MPSGERERYGSLLMAADHLPRDRHGHPYQVILVLLPGGAGTEDLRRDGAGRALAWVRDEQARPMAGADLALERSGRRRRRQPLSACLTMSTRSLFVPLPPESGGRLGW